MTDPLELMDWLESNTDHGFVNVKWEPFMKLRTALEAQRDELAQAKMQLAESEIFNQTMVCGICGGSRKFAAAIKAEVLREFADEQRKEANAEQYDGDLISSCRYAATAAIMKADRIEREAKEQGDD